MSPFHLFHLSLIGQHWWVLWFLVGVLFWLVLVLLLPIVDQSLRSSYLPMTILAQLRDCHSCYDERSIDQKKKNSSQSSSPPERRGIQLLQTVGQLAVPFHAADNRTYLL